jgi:hypothetical protein
VTLPSRAEWFIDSHLRGHSPAETIAYVSACMDAEDEAPRRRVSPGFVVSADTDPSLRGVLRRLFGRR